MCVTVFTTRRKDQWISAKLILFLETTHANECLVDFVELAASAERRMYAPERRGRHPHHRPARLALQQEDPRPRFMATSLRSCAASCFPTRMSFSLLKARTPQKSRRWETRPQQPIPLQGPMANGLRLRTPDSPWLRAQTCSLTIPGRMCQNGSAVPLQNPDWAGLVQGLRDAGMVAYKAGQSKNPDNVLMAADSLTTACSNCHDKYREKPDEKDRCM